MVQDFAKIRPEPILEKRAMESPPAWSLLFTGLVTGAAIGVFGCFLLYLSGSIPPLPGQPVVSTQPAQVADVAATPSQEPQPANEPAEDGEQGLILEFYDALPSYEVIVDATPVEIDEAQPDDTASPATNANTSAPATAPNVPGYMLQAGAFQQLDSANRQRARLEGLGLHTVIKDQSVTGGTLHLVQSGPFQGSQQVAAAESLLRQNNIPSLRIRLD